MTNTSYYGCSCGVEVVGLQDDPDWHLAYVSMYVRAGVGASLWGRVKAAWRVLRFGEWAANDAALDVEELTRFRDDLTRVISVKKEATK